MEKTMEARDVGMLKYLLDTELSRLNEETGIDVALFMGVDGIVSDYGISTPNIEEAHLNNVMIEISRELIVVTDSSKFLKKSFAFIAPVSRISTLITDSKIPDSEYSSISKQGVEIITV